MAKLQQWKEEDYDWDMCCEALQQSSMDIERAVDYYKDQQSQANKYYISDKVDDGGKAYLPQLNNVPSEYARVRKEVRDQFPYARLTGFYKIPLWSTCLLYKKHNINRAEDAIINYNQRNLCGDSRLDCALE